MSENTLLLVQVASMVDFADSGWEGGGGGALKGSLGTVVPPRPSNRNPAV